MSRLDQMDSYYRLMYRNVAGVDEAGRGPLAGPIVAAAVILNPNFYLPGLNDSKRLSQSQREALYQEVLANSLAYHVAWCSAAEIDAMGISLANARVLQQAVEGLRPIPEFVLCDYFPMKKLKIRHESLVKGDGRSATIAAASIVAKVTRDHYMMEVAKRYPEYGFEKHKGYGTREHQQALLTHGPCPEHRRTFSSRFIVSPQGVEVIT